jgi:plastocyanin
VAVRHPFEGLDPGESFAYRFDSASTYEYFCALHPYMTGRIVVE